MPISRGEFPLFFTVSKRPQREKAPSFALGYRRLNGQNDPFSEGKPALGLGSSTKKVRFSEGKSRKNAFPPSKNLILSRKEVMGTFMEFAQILETKIRKEMEKSAPASSEKASPKTELHSELWTHLVGHLDTRRFETPQKGQAYHRLRPAPRPRPDHKFSAPQSEAFEFFNQQGAALAANFSGPDLKKAFRSLALKLHPDQGGSAFKFQRLMQARAVLQTLF